MNIFTTKYEFIVKLLNQTAHIFEFLFKNVNSYSAKVEYFTKSGNSLERMAHRDIVKNLF